MPRPHSFWDGLKSLTVCVPTAFDSVPRGTEVEAPASFREERNEATEGITGGAV